MTQEATLALVSPSMRLAPVRRVGRASRAIRIAVGIAVLLHLLVGGLFLLHPPGFLAHPAAPPQREAEVEMIQNDMPATGSVPTGGAAKNNQEQDAGQHSSPAQQTPREAAAPPPASPNLATAPDSEVAPPQPVPGVQNAPVDAAPRTAVDAVKPAEHPQPDAPADEGAAIRLSTSDEEQGMSGGTADTPAAADPSHHNKLPAYPRDAAAARQSGLVAMVVHVRSDGTPAGVIVSGSSGSPSLDSAAVGAVQRWKFRPARDHGTAVESDIPVSLNFVLH